jgi:hypothetical protein
MRTSRPSARSRSIWKTGIWAMPIPRSTASRKLSVPVTEKRVSIAARLRPSALRNSNGASAPLLIDRSPTA